MQNNYNVSRRRILQSCIAFLAATLSPNISTAEPPIDENSEEYNDIINRRWKEANERINRRWNEADERINRRWEEADGRMNKVWQEYNQKIDRDWKAYNERINAEWQADTNLELNRKWDNLNSLDDLLQNRPRNKTRPSVPDYEPKTPNTEKPNRERIEKLELLAQKERLNKEEFNQLRSLVETLQDYRTIVKIRGIHYPGRSTRSLKEDTNKWYGSPLSTHNKRHGVCDEWALYFASFFVEKKGYELQLIEFENHKTAHAFTVYNAPNGKFGLSNSQLISTPTFESMNAAINEAFNTTYMNNDTGELFKYEKKNTKIFQKEIKEAGRWITEDKYSRKVNPSKRYRME